MSTIDKLLKRIDKLTEENNDLHVQVAKLLFEKDALLEEIKELKADLRNAI